MVKLLVHEPLLIVWLKLQTSNPSVFHLLVTLGTIKVLSLVVFIHLSSMNLN
jgi:hypothetical protein